LVRIDALLTKINKGITMLYRVKISVDGVLQVEADSPEMAEKIAKLATPTMSGKTVFGASVQTSCVGPVKNVQLHPDNVVQFVSNPTRTH